MLEQPERGGRWDPNAHYVVTMWIMLSSSYADECTPQHYAQQVYGHRVSCALRGRALNYATYRAVQDVISKFSFYTVSTQSQQRDAGVTTRPHYICTPRWIAPLIHKRHQITREQYNLTEYHDSHSCTLCLFCFGFVRRSRKSSRTAVSFVPRGNWWERSSCISIRGERHACHV